MALWLVEMMQAALQGVEVIKHPDYIQGASAKT